MTSRIFDVKLHGYMTFICTCRCHISLDVIDVHMPCAYVYNYSTEPTVINTLLRKPLARANSKAMPDEVLSRSEPGGR